MNGQPLTDNRGRILPAPKPNNPVLTLLDNRPVEMEPADFWSTHTNEEIEAHMRLKYPELHEEQAQ